MLQVAVCDDEVIECCNMAKHILPAGRYKYKYLIGCPFAENLCCFHPIQLLHNDIKENNIETFQCLQQFPTTSELTDNAW